MRLEAGQILFQRSQKEEQFGDAVKLSAKTSSMSVMTHVGLLYDMTTVIQSLPTKGVVFTDVFAFLQQANTTVITEVKRRELIPIALKRAQRWVGRSYNASFYPDNVGLYCSELIVNAFCDKNGINYFKTMPMNFKESSSGKTIPYWQRYFSELQLDIPQGVIGSHPELLFQQQSKLKFVMQFDRLF